MDSSKKNRFNKLEEFLRSVNNYVIIGLVETHTGPDNNICMDDYLVYQVNMPKSDQASKFSGGIAAMVKTELQKGVSLSRSDIFSFNMAKIGYIVLCLKDDIYLCITYLPLKIPGNWMWTVWIFWNNKSNTFQH